MTRTLHTQTHPVVKHGDFYYPSFTNRDRKYFLNCYAFTILDLNFNWPIKEKKKNIIVALLGFRFYFNSSEIVNTLAN